MKWRYILFAFASFAFLLAGCAGNEPPNEKSSEAGSGGVPYACGLVEPDEFASVLGIDTAVAPGAEYNDETGSGCSWQTEEGLTALAIGIWVHDGTASEQLRLMANPVDAAVTTEALPDIGDEAYIIDDGVGQAVMWREEERFFVMLSFVNLADREMALEMARLVDGRISP